MEKFLSLWTHVKAILIGYGIVAAVCYILQIQPMCNYILEGLFGVVILIAASFIADTIAATFVKHRKD